MVINIQDNLTSLNTVLGQYQKLSGLSAKDVLAKQGGKLAFSVYRSLRGRMPAKGKPSLDVMLRLDAGKFIKIRPSVRKAVERRRGLVASGGGEKRLKALKTKNYRKKGDTTLKGSGARRLLTLQQELVKGEIARRESGRGFLSISGRYPGILRDQAKAMSKYGKELSAAGVTVTGDGGVAKVFWSGAGSELAKSAAEGVTKPRQIKALADAIDATRDDILVYVRRKQMETVTGALKAMIK